MKRLAPARRLEWNWILYDVGNSAFTLMISTILPIYFDGLVTSAGLESELATAYWGYAASIVTLFVAILSPIMGTLSDFSGYKKPIFFFFACAGVVGCAALGIPMPWLVFLIVFIITKIFYSGSLVFYDAMLVDVTTTERTDIVSSKGYAFGYIGSCIPFLISIAIVLLTDLAYSVSIPIALVINALWWLGFTMPLMKSYKQTHFVPRTPHAVRDNFRRLFSVFSKKSDIPNKKGIILFLVAFFLYIDGVYTVIDMATSFGTALGFDTTNLLLALLLTQVIAFPAAIIMGKLAGKVRNDILILICIVAYTGVGIFAIFMNAVSGRRAGALPLLLCQDHPARPVGMPVRHPRYLRQGRGVPGNAACGRGDAGDGLRQPGRHPHRLFACGGHRGVPVRGKSQPPLPGAAGSAGTCRQCAGERRRAARAGGDDRGNVRPPAR